MWRDPPWSRVRRDSLPADVPPRQSTGISRKREGSSATGSRPRRNRRAVPRAAPSSSFPALRPSPITAPRPLLNEESSDTGNYESNPANDTYQICVSRENHGPQQHPHKTHQDQCPARHGNRRFAGWTKLMNHPLPSLMGALGRLKRSTAFKTGVGLHASVLFALVLAVVCRRVLMMVMI